MLDRELVDLYFETYVHEIEGFIPDLMDIENPDEADLENLADSITDFAGDYIYDREQPKTATPEIRAAATKIAEFYV